MPPSRLLTVGYDASQTGAPMLHLALITQLRRLGWTAEIALLNGSGPLLDAFQSAGGFAQLGGHSRFVRRGQKLADRLGPGPTERAAVAARALTVKALGGPFPVVHVNGAPTLPLVPVAAGPIVAHVHELDFSLRRLMDATGVELLRTIPVAYIAVSDAVREMLVDRVGVPRKTVHVVPPALLRQPDPRQRLPRQPPVVLAVGTLEWRKGTDVFVLAAAAAKRRGRADTRWVWLGAPESETYLLDLQEDVRRAGLENMLSIVGATDQPQPWFDQATVVVSTSREEAYGMAVIEAAATGVPLVCFDKAGGARELVGQGAGTVVPYLDIEAFVDAVLAYVDDPGAAAATGERGAAVVARDCELENNSAVVSEILSSVAGRG